MTKHRQKRQIAVLAEEEEAKEEEEDVTRNAERWLGCAFSLNFIGTARR